MAIGLVATRGTQVGEVLKKEYSPDYCRELVTVTVPAGGLEVGSVIAYDSTGGEYVLVTEALAGDVYGVLIDDTVNDEDYEEAGTYDLTLLVRGPAIVKVESLVYGADVTSTDTVLSGLEGLGILAK